jgi:hypothetical protein
MTLALVYAMDVAARMADEAAGGDGRVVSIVDARGVGKGGGGQGGQFFFF